MGNWILNNILTAKDTNYEHVFCDIAKKLFSDYKLEVANTDIQLKEVEFYYHIQDHPDPFVHQECYQQEFGLHLHNTGRGGIDLTFGDQAKGIYGGVLIRGVKIGENYYSGPLAVVEAIINLLIDKNRDLKKEITAEEYNRYYKNLLGNDCKLEKLTESKNNCDDMYLAPRVGLVCRENDCDDAKTGDNCKKYLVKRYRFITDIKPEHKFKEKTIAKATTECKTATGIAETNRVATINDWIEKNKKEICN